MTACMDTPAVSAEYRTIEDLVADARSRLDRLTPERAEAAVRAGSRLVDIRPAWQRAREGEIPGSLIVERNHLEWRLHPQSQARSPHAAPGRRWIVVCSEGYTSSLAADSLRSLGVPATDLVGGIQAWRASGLPVSPGPTAVERIAGADPLVDFGDFGGPHIEDKPAH
jgi:rhodanese-related sulfurtransferase